MNTHLAHAGTRTHAHVQIHIQTHPHTQPNAQAHAHAQAWNLEQASLGRDTEQAQNYRSTTENRRQRPRAHAHITVPRQIHVSEHAVAAMIPRKEEASLGHTWGERPPTDTKRTQLLAQHMAVVVCMFPRAPPRPDLPQLQHKTLPATLSVRRREDASQCHLWGGRLHSETNKRKTQLPTKKPGCNGTASAPVLTRAPLYLDKYNDTHALRHLRYGDGRRRAWVTHGAKMSLTNKQ